VFQTSPGASFIVNGATAAKNSALASSTELRLANGVTLLAKFDGEFTSHSSSIPAPERCATHGGAGRRGRRQLWVMSAPRDPAVAAAQGPLRSESDRIDAPQRNIASERLILRLL
jgi:hypothetical protein